MSRGHVGQQLCSWVSDNGGIGTEKVVLIVDGQIVVDVVNDRVESLHEVADHEEHDEEEKVDCHAPEPFDLVQLFLSIQLGLKNVELELFIEFVLHQIGMVLVLEDDTECVEYFVRLGISLVGRDDRSRLQ